MVSSSSRLMSPRLTAGRWPATAEHSADQTRREHKRQDGETSAPDVAVSLVDRLHVCCSK